MKTVKTSELEKDLKKLGYEVDRQNGSHCTWKNAETGKTAVTVNNRETPPGTLRSIINQVPELGKKYR